MHLYLQCKLLYIAEVVAYLLVVFREIVDDEHDEHDEHDNTTKHCDETYAEQMRTVTVGHIQTNSSSFLFTEQTIQ